MSPELITALTTTATALITAISTWWLSKPKDKNDYFKTLLEANEKFREEVREDLKSAKAEIEKYKEKIEELDASISSYCDKLLEYERLIKTYESQISENKEEISYLRNKYETK